MRFQEIKAVAWALVCTVCVVIGPAAAPAQPDGLLAAAQERALKPQDAFRECENCPEMVVVPAGSFTMGASETEEGHLDKEGPQHVVTIAKPFAVGKLHVTVDQFAAFVRKTGYQGSSKCWIAEGRKAEDRANYSWQNPGFAQDGSHPVVCVTWEDAKAYVKWVAQETGMPYRLLSEAEFEYAARGKASLGAYPRFWFGDNDRDLCRYANGADQKARDSIPGTSGWTFAPCNDGYAYTSPTGHYEPNAFGLYDMAGNAYQWTEDCWHDSYKDGPPSDGSAWSTAGCGNRVVRGGSWRYGPLSLRAAARGFGRSTTGFNFTSFRVARSLTVEVAQAISDRRWVGALTEAGQSKLLAAARAGNQDETNRVPGPLAALIAADSGSLARAE